MTEVSINTAQKDENLETYYLIWLDTLVNSLPENNQTQQQQLRTTINHYFELF